MINIKNTELSKVLDYWFFRNSLLLDMVLILKIFRSFELFSNNIHEIEIITFDELFERTYFIVKANLVKESIC